MKNEKSVIILINLIPAIQETSRLDNARPNMCPHPLQSITQSERMAEKYSKEIFSWAAASHEIIISHVRIQFRWDFSGKRGIQRGA